MKRVAFLWVGAAWLLATIGHSGEREDRRAAVDLRLQERTVIYQSFLAGNSREALERLLALPVPEGVSKDIFLLQELARLSLEFRNAQESEAAARVATIAVDLLTPDNVSKLQSRAERAGAWRLRAQIHELILPDSNAARAAWQLALAEDPADKRAADAIRKLDERAEHDARAREGLARDPMRQPGFVPTPASSPVNP